MPYVIATPNDRKAIVLPVGVVDPPFTDTITRNGALVDLTEATVKFYMRPLLSRKAVIEGESGEVISPPDTEKNNVRYHWTEGDVANEGEFMAWWSFTKAGLSEETPEFPITFTSHAPGIGTETGAIADGAADYMPLTYAALSNDQDFGDRRIQKYATLIQLRITGTSVQPAEESSNYNEAYLAYFSKRLAFELCGPGIDYWGRQVKTTTAQSPTEISSYPEMLEALDRLRNRLRIELEQDWRDLAFLVPTALPQRRAVPMPSNSFEFAERPEANGRLQKLNMPYGPVTKNPYDTQRLQTGWWGAFDVYTLGFYPFP